MDQHNLIWEGKWKTTTKSKNESQLNERKLLAYLLMLPTIKTWINTEGCMEMWVNLIAIL